MVPVGERAGRRVRGQIGTQPLSLRRARVAAADRSQLALRTMRCQAPRS